MVATIQRTGKAIRQRQDFIRDQQTFVTAFCTDLNWMAVAWRDDVVQRIAFGHSSRRLAEISIASALDAARLPSRIIDDSRADNVPGFVNELNDDLQRFAAGEPVDFSHVALNLDHLTPFALRVVNACRRIPWSQTRSYGELAAKCGAPGAARAVGSVMAKNRFPLIVPCHRVLSAGGALGGYSAPDGLRMKRRLLAMEGSLNE